MFKQKKIITAIELGTSKVAAAVGEIDRDGTLSVLCLKENPADGTVCKGAVTNLEQLSVILRRTVDELEAASKQPINRSDIYVAVTGAGIKTLHASGSIYISSPESEVTEENMNAALHNAQMVYNNHELINIGNISSFFCLDDTRLIANPLKHKARKLEAKILQLFASEHLLHSFNSPVNSIGFDGEPLNVFSPVAVLFGILTEDEKQHGTLLLDMGAGTTEYIVINKLGIICCGVLEIGLEHIANDLAIGLKLNIDTCRRLIRDGSIAEHLNSGAPHLQVKEKSLATVRKLPVASLEKIITLRLEETFSIIKKRIGQETELHALERGIVFTGGGALFEPAVKTLQRSFEMQIRVGKPFRASGAVSHLNSPRYSLLWGLLKCGEFNYLNNSGSRSGHLLNSAETIADSVLNRLKKIKDAIPF